MLSFPGMLRVTPGVGWGEPINFLLKPHKRLNGKKLTLEEAVRDWEE